MKGMETNMNKKKNIIIISILIIILMILTILLNTNAKVAIAATNVPQINITFKDSSGNTIDELKIEHQYQVINEEQSGEQISWNNKTDEYYTSNGTIVIPASNTSSYNGIVKVKEVQSIIQESQPQFNYYVNIEDGTPTGINTNYFINISENDITTNFSNGIAYINVILENNQNEGNVKITELPEIGKALQVIADNDSNSQSISIKQAVEYFGDNGITINSIKDIEGNDVNLSSDDLLGTGAKIGTNKGEYTAVVYGDATGDGEINAADISVVINYFLGNNTDLVAPIKVAGDVYEDKDLNAADISLMIDCFLGDLNGSILQHQ